MKSRENTSMSKPGKPASISMGGRCQTGIFLNDPRHIQGFINAAVPFLCDTVMTECLVEYVQKDEEKHTLPRLAGKGTDHEKSNR